MPTLHWIGKDEIINHKPPFHFLETDDSLSVLAENETTSENRIIQGDNLLALKALLPEYAGKIKCIYIDPPYNTGNEGWIYNDKVKSPTLKQWLNQTVGNEGEDLNRHDKWLCMMYPRLMLLKELLAEDGAIFVSIDDNEQANLKLLMDEVFGGNNFIGNVHWRRSESQNNSAKHLSVVGEFIIVYCKEKEKLQFNKTELQETALKEYRYEDKNGKFRRGTIVDNTRGKHIIEIVSPSGLKKTIKSIRSEDFLLDKIEKGLIYWANAGTPYLKLYLEKSEGQISSNWFDKQGVNEDAADCLKAIGVNFPFSKPPALIEKIIQIASDPNAIILDSFAGSGTTAHAVLNLNKKDGGNRKFILVEMEEHIAPTITAERVKRVINGYGTTEGTGGSFIYQRIGKPLLDELDNIQPNIPYQTLAAYVFYHATKQVLAETPKEGTSFLGTYTQKEEEIAVYFLDAKGVLNKETYAALVPFTGNKVIYAELNHLGGDFCKAEHITFKQIPTVFQE